MNENNTNCCFDCMKLSNCDLSCGEPERCHSNKCYPGECFDFKRKESSNKENIIVELIMEDLERCFKYAKKYGYEYIGVKIKMEGFAVPEVIINPRENFDSKLAYYKKVYNDNLTLKSFNGVKIIGFTCGEDYKEIESDLMEIKN